jgi:hypothetical protein
VLLGSVNVFAAEDTTNDENSSTKITISFKSGTGIYSVNGKTVKSEASALVLGKTFVPVNVIADALSATLTLNLKAKTAIINYNGIEIKLTDKKKEAVIAGKTVKIDAAPYIKNSIFMASISFLADTLGADITNENGQVSFVKEIANPNSIKDFSTLIKNTTKDKIGDSYYKWSMMLPNDLKLDYRNFNGTKNWFYSQDGSYFVEMFIYDKGEAASFDNVINNLIEYTKDYTLIDYGLKSNTDGIQYVEFIYKDDKLTHQLRVYFSDTKEYDLEIIIDNDDSYLDEKYQNISDSFQFKFNKDGNTEDMSDVSANGYRKYQDTRLKWSIDMHPDWREFKDDKIQNKVIFNGPDNAFFSTEVYSLDKGETLESVTQDSIRVDKEKYNASLLTIKPQESSTIGGVACNKVYYSIKILKETFYGCDIILVDKNYKYILSYELSEKDYGNLQKKDFIEGMINSFKFKELNPKTIGKLLDPEKVVLTKDTRKVSKSLFSMEIPSIMKEEKNNTDEDNSYYSSTLYTSVNIINNSSLSSTIASLDTYFAEKSGSDYRVESKVSTTEKDMTCYKYILVYILDGIEYRDECYVLQKGSNVFIIDITVENIFYGTKNINIMNEIWKSFTIN